MTRPAAMRAARPGRPKGSTRRQVYQRKKNPEYWVCLIGFNDLIPRSFSDQRGGYPVAIVSSKKPKEAIKKYDYGQPYHRIVVLERCAVETEEHSKRLKAALDMALVGNAARQNNDPTRGIWRDSRGCFEVYDDESRHMWWLAMLVAAEMEVRKTIKGFRSLDARENGIDDLIMGLG